MKSYNLKLGALISIFLALAMVPIRLSQGQDFNLTNLIGSEITIALMILTMWILIYRIYHHVPAGGWQKIILCALVCAALSNLFYWLSNPLFEDYPLKPMRTLPLWLATFRLSLRGILAGLMIIPIVFLTEKQKEIQEVKFQRQLERAEYAEKQQHHLELLVQERTAALQQTLSALDASYAELNNHVYNLSRVVTSITHDVQAPLSYATMISGRIVQILDQKEYATATEFTLELTKSLTGLGAMMDNLLEFTKVQLRKEKIRHHEVDLVKLAEDKVTLFSGIANARNNQLDIEHTGEMYVQTNYSLASVIIHNLMDNATKYTRNGLIKISILQENHAVLFRIENTNERINYSADQQDAAGSPGKEAIFEHPEDGIGLILVKEIARLLHVDFSIQGNPSFVTAEARFARPNKEREQIGS